MASAQGAEGEPAWKVAARHVTNDWWTLETDSLSAEDIKMLVQEYLHPDVVFYPDGIIYKDPLRGIDAYVEAMKQEQRAYEVDGQSPEQIAAVPVTEIKDWGERSPGGAPPRPHTESDRVFDLTTMQLKNVGEWRGQAATGKVSHISQVSELRLDERGKVVEGWVRRQLTEEERAALLKDPGKHPSPKIDWKQHLGGGTGKSGATVREGRLWAIDNWIQVWNLAGAEGTGDRTLDTVLEPDFTLHDALGIHAAEKHPWQAIHSKEDAKKAVQEFTSKYNVSELVVSRTADDGTGPPIGFAHWEASWMPKELAAEEPAGEGALKLVKMEALDVVVFGGPEGTRIKEIWQWRGPTPLEQRRVLEPEGQVAA